MKYGLLVTSPIGLDKNIGDYMQSLAAMQFLPHVDSYVEKESISTFQYREPLKTIMNAWYIWHPENWPPTEDNLKPLMTSIHIMPAMLDKMLENGGKEYFAKHAPIGCRDTNTAEMLTAKGIEAYFSGCMTLTLGVKYKRNYDRRGVVFVDPYIPPYRIVSNEGKFIYPKNIFKSIGCFLMNPIKTLKLSKKPALMGRYKIISIYNASMFYHAYSSLFTDEVLFNAEYISHMVLVGNHKTQEDWLRTTEQLLEKYSKTSYVVTSRIHCALPCLGIDTPVIFTLGGMMKSDKNLIGSPGRYGGLMDFFRVIEYSGKKMVASDNMLKEIGKIGFYTKFKNKTNCDKYKKILIQQCLDFVKNY